MIEMLSANRTTFILLTAQQDVPIPVSLCSVALIRIVIPTTFGGTLSQIFKPFEGLVIKQVERRPSLDQSASGDTYFVLIQSQPGIEGDGFRKNVGDAVEQSNVSHTSGLDYCRIIGIW